MATADINQLDVSTLDAAGIARLIASGETVVERKGDVPRNCLGPSFAAYANSGGGWLLLGSVTTAPRSDGRPPGRRQEHDWFRDVLRDDIDPLPSFGCRTVECRGKSVVALRIYPGVPPYVLRGSGVIYVYESPAASTPCAHKRSCSRS